MRLTITDTMHGDVAADVQGTFAAEAHAEVAEDIGTWIYHRIAATFASR